MLEIAVPSVDTVTLAVAAVAVDTAVNSPLLSIVSAPPPVFIPKASAFAVVSALACAAPLIDTDTAVRALVAVAMLATEPTFVTESSPLADVDDFSKLAAMPLSSMVSEKSISELASPPSVEIPVAEASAVVSASTLAFALLPSLDF